MKFVSAAEAGERLRSGEVGLLPTETVVGLIAAEAGLSRLWGVKVRDPGKPVARLCASPEEALAAAERVPALAEKLAERFWPGPLTLVLDRPGGGTVGVRVPDHQTVAAVLRAHGEPFYATSANISGEPAPAMLAEVDRRVSKAVDFAVEGESGGGEASAVVDLSAGRVRLLRATPGLDEETLQELSAG